MAHITCPFKEVFCSKFSAAKVKLFAECSKFYHDFFEICLTFFKKVIGKAPKSHREMTRFPMTFGCFPYDFYIILNISTIR